jgi:NAD(P)-dependent dehydrogenase (short-subunit alcohol dehydrogenase family)
VRASDRPDEIPGPLTTRFIGKVALVTGGGTASLGPGSTLGVAICRLLAQEGCRVAVMDRDPVAAARTVEMITNDGGAALRRDRRRERRGRL